MTPTEQRPRFTYLSEVDGWRGRNLVGALGLRVPRCDQDRESNVLLARAASGATNTVEIGAFEGGGSITIRHAMRHGTLTIIDPYFKGRFGLSLALVTAKRQARKQRFVETRWVRQSSLEAADEWAGTVDLLVIDAIHTLEGVTADWHAWGRFVRPEGRLVARNLIVPNSHLPHPERSAELLQLAAPDPGQWRLIDSSHMLAAFERV